MSRLLLEAIGFLANGGWKLDTQLDEARRKVDLCVATAPQGRRDSLTAAVVRGLPSPAALLCPGSLSPGA